MTAEQNLANLTTQQMDEAKAPLGVFDLPCGYLSDGKLITDVEVREITGDEEDMLGSKKISDQKKIGELISRCVSRVGSFQGQQARDVLPYLTVGDRTFLMFAIRRVSLGDDYPFVDKCPNCELEQLFVLDLSTLDIRAMTDPMKRTYDIKLPSSGKQVTWHVMIGKDEEFINKYDKSGLDSVSLAVLARLDSIDGTPVNLSPIAGKPAALLMVKSLNITDRNALRDDFDEREGGVETTMDMSCPSCGHEFSRELEIGTTGFFFPSRARKDWKKKSNS